MDSFEAVVTPFLKKLLILVNDTPKEVGEWDDEGKVFIVKISSRFEESLRRYFKGTLQTFIRQLHFYGFSKMDMPRNHTNSWSFSHPYFLRDQPALITNIKRKVSSQNHTNSSAESSGTPTPSSNKKKCSNGCSCSSANDSLLRRKDQEIEDLRRQVASLTDTVNDLANFVGFKRPIAMNNNNTLAGVYGQYAVQGAPTVEKLTKKRMRSEQLATTAAAAAANGFHPSTFQSSPLDNNLVLRGEINEKRHKAAAEEMFSNFLEFSGLPLMDIGRSMNEIKRNDDENTVASVATEDLMSDFVREFESPANLSYSLLDKQAKFAKSDNTKYPSLEQASSSQKSEEVTV